MKNAQHAIMRHYFDAADGSVTLFASWRGAGAQAERGIRDMRRRLCGGTYACSVMPPFFLLAFIALKKDGSALKEKKAHMENMRQTIMRKDGATYVYADVLKKVVVGRVEMCEGQCRGEGRKAM